MRVCVDVCECVSELVGRDGCIYVYVSAGKEKGRTYISRRGRSSEQEEGETEEEREEDTGVWWCHRGPPPAGVMSTDVCVCVLVGVVGE